MSDDETLPRVLPRDVPDYHALAATDQATGGLKDRLVQEAEKHKRLALRQKLGRWWGDKVAAWQLSRR